MLFLDKFDRIGKKFNFDHRDVGEKRRVVNSIIQLIDYFPKDNLLICATNHYYTIDTALLRRFQICLQFETSIARSLLSSIIKYFPNSFTKYPK